MFYFFCIFAMTKGIIMCTYPISLDDNLVMQAESVLGINDSFQNWLQEQVELWLRSKVKRRNVTNARRNMLDDEALTERLKDYPLLEESCFPSLAAEDYSIYLKSHGGKLPKGSEKWL